MPRQKEYGDEEFVEAVEEVENATTGAVAHEVGCSRGTAWRYLNRLVDEDKLCAIEVSGVTTIYETR